MGRSIDREMNLLPLLQETNGKDALAIDCAGLVPLQRPTHASTHLVEGIVVAPLVLAVLALVSLVTIEGATVAAAPSGLNVAMLDLGAPLGFLLLAHDSPSAAP